jgi:hypothetical protein
LVSEVDRAEIADRPDLPQSSTEWVELADGNGIDPIPISKGFFLGGLLEDRERTIETDEGRRR